MLWALWRMHLKCASRLFLRVSFLFLAQHCFCLCVVVYLGDESLEHLKSIASRMVLPLVMILALQFRRHFNKRKAWQVVAEDADSYDLLWGEISQRHADSVTRLSEASKQVMADIDKAVSEGPQCHLCDAENLRRTLLPYKRRQAGRLLQSLSSLPLLFAQAAVIDVHFQRKCAEWATDVGTHMAGLIKQPSRAVQKVWRVYNGNPQSLVDLVRASIVCDTPEQVLTVLRKVQADSAVRILRIKNRFDPHFDSIVSGGYRNLALNVIIFDADSLAGCAERHICELQIGLREMQALKTEGGHRRFVAFRDGRAE
eukprot:TRINITY_DN32803_c0_g5_i3.p1 TRINITY_DN32803_c0_g5~~TRINITY_DN32803_c0_g5_i3.p1  ORF type:complete len:313 (-),score=41.14 TRINITY_DN32803_c0_g5_i3:350-1288(-)